MSEAQVDRSEGDRLVSQLFSDPERFAKKGMANDLLKQFFEGYPLDHLRSLLRHANHKVVEEGIWIASELPSCAAALLDDALVLARHPDRQVRFFALDVVMLGTVGGRTEGFIRVVEGLDDRDPVISDHALFLLSRAAESQLATAMKYLERVEPDSRHLAGLGMLAAAQSTDPALVEDAIQSSDSLRRRYGLAAAERAYGRHPSLLDLAAHSQDDSIRSLAEHMLKQHRVAQRSREH
jgi:hypothetical protein